MTINDSFKLLSSVGFGWFSLWLCLTISPRQNRLLMIPIKVVVCFATLSSIALMPTSLQFVVIIFQTFEYQQKNAIPVLCSLPLQRWPTECWNLIWVTSGGITANHSLCEENIRQDTVLELLLVWFGEISSFWPDTFVHHVIPLLSTKIWCPPTRTSNPQDWKQRGIWLVQCVMREDLAISRTQGHCHQLQSCHLTYYCWWLKSTTKDDDYPIIF